MGTNEPAVLHRLSLQDLTNLAVEAPDTPMHVGALGILEGGPLLDENQEVRIEAIRRSIDARLALVPALRRVLWRTRPFQGRPLWVDSPGFRIENHIVRAALPSPGGEAAALRFAELEMRILMDRSRPLWQLWFLDGYAPGKVAVFLKLHHVLADGAAVLNIISLLFDFTAEAVLLTPSEEWSPVPPPAPPLLYRDSVVRKLSVASTAWGRLIHPVALARSAARSIRAIWTTIREGAGAPRTSFNRPVGSSRRVAVMRIGLAEAKAVAHASGAKVNDVVLSVIAGGLREVLIRRGEAVEDVSIRASMAVALQPRDQSALVGNHAGTVIVPLPVSEADPRLRLDMIQASTARAKKRQRGAMPEHFMVFLALTGLTRFFIKRQHLVNVLVTNLAGPHAPLYIVGARLLDAFAITPIAGNVTASFAALSYDGHLDLSVCADTSCWTDLGVLADGMEAAWQEMSMQSRAA